LTTNGRAELNAALIKAKWVNVCGKFAQRFALFVGLFRAESQVICVAQHALEQEPRLRD